MIRALLVFALFLASGSLYAKAPCAGFHGKQSYPPLSVGGGAICFIREPISDKNTGMSIGLDGIALYYIDNAGVSTKAEGLGLLYDDTPGEIVDAFLLEAGRDGREKIFVIHAFEVRSSLAESDSSGKFYSVIVFDLSNNILRQNERFTDWFGAGYGWLSDGKNVIYRFPYQSRRDVLQAVRSPFASLMEGAGKVSAEVKYKSYLSDWPSVRGKTKRYLTKGERVEVVQVSAGWCRVDYSGSQKSNNMWLMCSALDVR
ncbi:hypothetical protein QZN00_08875 [Burkholderia multivorans]|nr:hypothetical protein [Burkholderia multivorans]